MLNGKTIVLGVTGGIAAYKAAELVRLFVKSGANVHVVMTEAATKFIAPLTFQTLSSNPVHTELFDLHGEDRIGHIRLAQDVDLIVVAPATANILGKIAHGLGDDLLSTILLAAGVPVLLAPAMNDRMWLNPAVVHNVELLRGRGYAFTDPESGELACKTVSVGRMAEPEAILDHGIEMLTPKSLAGKTIVVSAGPTYEPLDDVRMITNRSSGRMGFAMALAARDRGARVTLVTGPTSLKSPARIETARVTTAMEMRAAVDGAMQNADALVMCAAVADKRPASSASGKMRKDEMGAAIALEPNPDILAEMAARYPRAVKIGFAAQTNDWEAEGARKLSEKGADYFVVNNVADPAIGFDSDSNEGFLLKAAGGRVDLPRTDKRSFAGAVLDHVFGEARGDAS